MLLLIIWLVCNVRNVISCYEDLWWLVHLVMEKSRTFLSRTGMERNRTANPNMFCVKWQVREGDFDFREWGIFVFYYTYNIYFTLHCAYCAKVFNIGQAKTRVLFYDSASLSHGLYTLYQAQYLSMHHTKILPRQIRLHQGYRAINNIIKT